MKIKKGDYGYIPAQKKKTILITVVCFGLCLAVFIAGLIVNKMNRLNMFTFVAIMGCLPSAKFAVGMIMILIQKELPREAYEKIHGHMGELTCAYDLVITAYEKNTSIGAVAICGYEVAAYTHSEKTDIPFAEEHITTILKGNGYKAHVKIFSEQKAYLERLDYLNKNREEMEKDIPLIQDETYPDLSRSELVKHTLLAISL